MKRVIPVPAQRLESGTKAAPAAQSNTPVNGLRFHVSNAAGFGEAITEKAEVGRHPAKVEGDARDTTADLCARPSRRSAAGWRRAWGLSSNGAELLGKASFRPPRRGRAGFLSGRSSPRAILSGSEKA